MEICIKDLAQLLTYSEHRALQCLLFSPSTEDVARCLVQVEQALGFDSIGEGSQCLRLVRFDVQLK